MTTHEKPALPSLAALREAVEAMERDVAGRVGPVTHWEGCTSDPAHWRCKYAATFRAWLAAMERSVVVHIDREEWEANDLEPLLVRGTPMAGIGTTWLPYLLIPLTEADA